MKRDPMNMTSPLPWQSDKPRVAIIGALPPPYHGASINTKKLADSLKESGADVEMISTSVGALAHNKGIKYHLKRVVANINAVFKQLKLIGRSYTIYVVLDGGWGLIYTTLHVTLAVLSSRRLLLAHHTSWYINRPGVIGKLVHLLGHSGIHIFLSAEMAEKYQKSYGNCHFLISDNSHFALNATVPVGLKSYTNIDELKIGMLSNLCDEKGIYEALKLFSALSSARKVHFILAGPAQSLEVAHAIQSTLAHLTPNMTYLGAIYGAEKDAFFREIDIFVFPTKYKLEAQPNVIYEALSYGVPVITRDVGFIKEQVFDGSGFVVPQGVDFVDTVSELLTLGSWRETLKIAEPEQIREKFTTRAAKSAREFNQLVDYLITSDVACLTSDNVAGMK